MSPRSALGGIAAACSSSPSSRALTEHFYPHTPSISVLLASRRADDLPQAVEQVAQQLGCDVQLLVGLHGPSFDAMPSNVIAERWAGPLVIERFSQDVALGQVLQSLARASDGPLIAKWDDDDWYGPHHLADLALAHAYSGADVVGKAAEFVYITSRDVTIRRYAVGAESYSTTIAGGTLLLDRDWLDEIGGWAPVRFDVDKQLITTTLASGGTTYRTHGFQYVLRRRPTAAAHTWTVSDDYFLDAATDAAPGLALAFADVR